MTQWLFGGSPGSCIAHDLTKENVLKSEVKQEVLSSHHTELSFLYRHILTQMVFITDAHSNERVYVPHLISISLVSRKIRNAHLCIMVGGS